MWEDYIKELLEGFDFNSYLNMAEDIGGKFAYIIMINDLAKYLGDRLTGKIEGYEY
jgi:hypothetical protein